MKKTALVLLAFFAFFVLVNQSYADITTGLVGHYKFDGNANDSSGYGNNGTAQGGPSYVNGPLNQAIELDGVNDYVQLAAASSLNMGVSPFTISAFIKKTVGNGSIFIKYSTPTGYMLGVNPTGSLGFGTYNASNGTTWVSGNASVIDGTWHHVAAVREADGTLKLYIDGVLDNALQFPIVNVDNPIGPRIGCDSQSYQADTFFNGTMDDVRIYNRALSSSDIQSLYSSGNIVNCILSPGCPSGVQTCDTGICTSYESCSSIIARDQAQCGTIPSGTFNCELSPGCQDGVQRCSDGICTSYSSCNVYISKDQAHCSSSDENIVNCILSPGCPSGVQTCDTGICTSYESCNSIIARDQAQCGTIPSGTFNCELSPGCPDGVQRCSDGICTSYSSCNVYISKDQAHCSVTAIELSSFTANGAFNKVSIQWKTETEVDNAGFNLYRSTSKEGTYSKINAALISAKGSPSQGATYKFIDTEVKNRNTYYYKLEDIDLNGQSTMHGPVSATPRLIFGFGN
jgi:hypothetical protein